MKCSKCGAKAKDINGMRKHYLRSHPGAMKRKKRVQNWSRGEKSMSPRELMLAALKALDERGY